MLKTRAGKREVEAAGGGPKPKRQRAGPACKDKIRNASMKRRVTHPRAPQGALGNEVALSDLPDNVLANVFGALGLDRLRAMQGKQFHWMSPEGHLKFSKRLSPLPCSML